MLGAARVHPDVRPLAGLLEALVSVHLGVEAVAAPVELALGAVRDAVAPPAVAEAEVHGRGARARARRGELEAPLAGRALRFEVERIGRAAAGEHLQHVAAAVDLDHRVRLGAVGGFELAALALERHAFPVLGCQSEGSFARFDHAHGGSRPLDRIEELLDPGFRHAVGAHRLGRALHLGLAEALGGRRHGGRGRQHPQRQEEQGANGHRRAPGLVRRAHRVHDLDHRLAPPPSQ